MQDLEAFTAAQVRIGRMWWQFMPEQGWTESTLTWLRVQQCIWRELIMVRDDGQKVSGSMPDALQDELIAFQDAHGTIGQPRPFGFTMQLSNTGKVQVWITWDKRVHFHTGPEAPFQPGPQDPSMPTDEMWRAELAQYPRPADRIPDWWQALL